MRHKIIFILLIIFHQLIDIKSIINFVSWHIGTSYRSQCYGEKFAAPYFFCVEHFTFSSYMKAKNIYREREQAKVRQSFEHLPNSYIKDIHKTKMCSKP